MNLTPSDLFELSQEIETVVQKAGHYVNEAFKSEYETLTKEDAPSEASKILTAVDLKSQEIILKELSPVIRQFDLGVLAEESEDDKSRLEKPYFLAIDPLDGTLAFTEGRPGFSVVITLLSKKGIPLIAHVFDGYTKDHYSAIKDQGAFLNQKKWTPLSKSSSSNEVHLFMDSSFKKHPQFNAHQKQIAQHFDEAPQISPYFGGAAMNAIQCLLNHQNNSNPSAYYKPTAKKRGGGSIWDFAASALLFREVKGYGGDFKGNPLDLNSKVTPYMNKHGIIFSTNSKLFELIKSLRA